MEEIDRLVAAGTDMIALDCTDRPRVDGKTAVQHLADIKRKYPHQLLMADVATLQEGLQAAAAGADAVSTTLNGYTAYTQQDQLNGPNFGLVKLLSAQCPVPVIAEGKIHYPWEARKMLKAGAWSVVVGGAITRPKEIAERFIAKMDEK